MNTTKQHLSDIMSATNEVHSVRLHVRLGIVAVRTRHAAFFADDVCNKRGTVDRISTKNCWVRTRHVASFFNHYKCMSSFKLKAIIFFFNCISFTQVKLVCLPSAKRQLSWKWQVTEVCLDLLNMRWCWICILQGKRFIMNRRCLAFDFYCYCPDQIPRVFQAVRWKKKIRHADHKYVTLLIAIVLPHVLQGCISLKL